MKSWMICRSTSTKAAISSAFLRCKELVKNKASISCEFGNSAVVPFGQVIVKDDFHVLFEIGGVFTPGLVHLVQHPHRHAQAGRGLRTFDELLRDVHRV